MSLLPRLRCLGLVVSLMAFVPAASAQVELDRIVSRVGNRIITASDVRQCRQLKLLDDVTSDESTQRGLEDRWLILAEMNRAAAVAPPSDADVTAHRAEWLARLGAAPNLPAAGMTDVDLVTWLRDDLRIRAYLKRQFGMLVDADRVKATSDWLARLRERAALR